ncbi:MAG: PQQ-dependent sugar dehydrogenase [Phycisphaerales bacterium]
MDTRPDSFTRRCTVAALALGMLTAAGMGAQPDGPVTPTGETEPETGWRLAEVTRGLMRPWGAAWLPDGRTMLVTEREGRLRVVQDGRLSPDLVGGIPDDLFASGQGGLLDVQVHPEFATNRLVYLTMSTGDNNANRTQLVRGRLAEDLSELTRVEVVYRVPHDKRGGQHFGSRILWLDDGTLLLSIGDGGNPPIRLDGSLIRERAQDLSYHHGKILHMNDDGSPVADAPFATDGDPDTDALIHVYGLRNVQGMAIRPGTDEVWATSHGARGGDELNRITPGTNYGWPEVTYSVEYWGPRISQTTQRDGVEQPRVVWTPCIAPSGLTFYTGDDFPEWQGDLFAGGLVLQQIRRIDFEDGAIVGQTTLQLDDRVRWVGMGPDGGLYMLTDEIDGGLYRVVPDDAS